MKFENLFPIYDYPIIDKQFKIQHYIDLNNSYDFYLLKSNRIYFRLLNKDIINIKLNDINLNYLVYIFHIQSLKNYYWSLVNDAGIYKLYISYISMNYLIDDQFENKLIFIGNEVPNIEVIKSIQINNKLQYLSAYKKFLNKLYAIQLLYDIKK